MAEPPRARLGGYDPSAPCPPLPTIGRIATGAQRIQASEHFVCLAERQAKGNFTPATISNALQAATNWVNRKLYEAMMAEEGDAIRALQAKGVQVVKKPDVVAFTPTPLPAPRVVAPSRPVLPPPAPASAAPLAAPLAASGGAVAPRTVQAAEGTVDRRLFTMAGQSKAGSLIQGAISIGSQVLPGLMSKLSGGSRCPGPYDYVNGQCVPKSDFAARTQPTYTLPQQPAFTGVPPAKGTSPGVATPAEVSTMGIPTGIDSFGRLYAEPEIRQPIRRKCPPGMVLGRNDLCYRKGDVPGSQRKWRPRPKPLVSAQDAKVLRRVDTIRGRIKDAWRIAGKPGQARTRR
jgi:hypothetical protein